MCQADERYVRHCLDGYPDAFRHLVVRHQDSLARYLTGRLGNEEEAVEAAQEAMVRAYFTLRKLKNPGSFYAWLLGIADRVAKEMLRDKQRRPQMASPDRQTAADHHDRPRPAVRRAVGELPEAYRKVILLRYYGGLSCAEISRDQAMPLGTVTKYLSRAYALLRESLLKQQELGDSEV